ncbi:hypothetical protein MSG28_008512 [Choristoneura fumiferana]|uniref:Uncharacterized protein n=1 Tax=Choristoneura fumiferana TaxID=7141 RepID=A0ACC0J714_CHOFU|nr:hypothetical protein MSG28_008512 [Choristoneura fumiferana]
MHSVAPIQISMIVSLRLVSPRRWKITFRYDDERFEEELYAQRAARAERAKRACRCFRLKLHVHCIGIRAYGTDGFVALYRYFYGRYCVHWIGISASEKSIQNNKSGRSVRTKSLDSVVEISGFYSLNIGTKGRTATFSSLALSSFHMRSRILPPHLAAYCVHVVCQSSLSSMVPLLGKGLSLGFPTRPVSTCLASSWKTRPGHPATSALACRDADNHLGASTACRLPSIDFRYVIKNKTTLRLFGGSGLVRGPSALLPTGSDCAERTLVATTKPGELLRNSKIEMQLAAEESVDRSTSTKLINVRASAPLTTQQTVATTARSALGMLV